MGLFSKKISVNNIDDNKFSIANKIREIFSNKNLSNENFEYLLGILIQADINVELAENIVNNTRKIAKSNDQIIPTLKEVIRSIYKDKELIIPSKQNTVILMVGVNGCGKTTTISKLANKYLQENKTVGLIAADTFRAGAKDQLLAWSEKLNIHCCYGKDNEDPSSVIVKGCQYYKNNPVDIILIDTAGRLQNKTNLMNELAKMKRVISKDLSDEPTFVWLTIDATTGQNGLLQAKQFIESSCVNGIILTKFDGTSRGGVVLSINQQHNIPVVYITYGESIDRLAEFKLDDYLDKLLRG